MNSDCYFEECNNCINKEYNDQLYCCLNSRLSLAWHKFLLELPIINRLIDRHKHCNWFEKE